MARVTVEDCVGKVPNRFDLVLLSAERARVIAKGAAPAVERENDKPPVLALREIAEEHLDPQDLREAMIHGLQNHARVDDASEGEASVLSTVEGEEVIVKPEAAAVEELGEDTIIAELGQMKAD